MELQSPPPAQNGPRNGTERQPWPMWPIALSILCFIVFYTWVQLNYRKSEKPYEPSHAMQERRAQIAEKNLYGWYSLNAAQREAFQTTAPASVRARVLKTALEEDLPSEIVYYIPRRPILTPKLESLAAESRFAKGEPIRLSFALPEAFGKSPDFHLAAFYKEGDLRLLAEMRVETEADLAKLDPQSAPVVRHYSIDSGPIEAETVKVTLYFQGQVREWTLSMDSPDTQP